MTEKRETRIKIHPATYNGEALSRKHKSILEYTGQGRGKWFYKSNKRRNTHRDKMNSGE